MEVRDYCAWYVQKRYDGYVHPSHFEHMTHEQQEEYRWHNLYEVNIREKYGCSEAEFGECVEEINKQMPNGYRFKYEESYIWA